MVSGGPQLLLAEERAGRFSTVLQSVDGTEKRLPATTPATDLIAATEIDYREYRGDFKRLRDEHPLFENRPDISVVSVHKFGLIRQTSADRWHRRITSVIDCPLAVIS